MGEFGPPTGVVGATLVALCLLGAAFALATGAFLLATGRFPRFLPAPRSRVRAPAAVRLAGVSAIILGAGFVGLAWEFHELAQGRFSDGPLAHLFMIPITLALALQGLAYWIDRQAGRSGSAGQPAR